MDPQKSSRTLKTRRILGSIVVVDSAFGSNTGCKSHQLCACTYEYATIPIEAIRTAPSEGADFI